jgi:hypothetical protein
MNSETALVTNVMTILMPYVVKGAEEFAKLVGEAAYNKARHLFEVLKARFAEDPTASDSLTRFEQKPQTYQPLIEDILKEKILHDKDFAAELARLVEDLGPEITVVQQLKVAENVVGIDAEEMTRGKVTVEQNIDEAKNVTGAKISKIG